MGAGVDIYSQVVAKNEAQAEAAKRQKIQEAQERQQLEVKLKEQAALEEEKARQKRLKLVAMTEQDRKRAQDVSAQKKS